MESIEISIHTGSRGSVTDLTSEVARFCAGKGDGLLTVFLPHATAGLAIMETGAGSDVDLLDAIDDLIPAEPGRWRHDHGSPGHGRDHLLPAFIAPTLTIPVRDGKPTLGVWQSIVLVDTSRDNRTRRVHLSFLESGSA